MEQKVRDLLSRVRSSAEILGDKTGKAYKTVAEGAGKKAAEALESTKLNLKVLELNSEIDQLYKEIGMMVFDTHQGLETDEEELQTKLTLIDEKHVEIDGIRVKIKDIKSEMSCPICGKSCKKTDTFCSGCGSQL